MFNRNTLIPKKHFFLIPTRLFGYIYSKQPLKSIFNLHNFEHPNPPDNNLNLTHGTFKYLILQPFITLHFQK
jgi:hypothetical protein